MAEIRESTARIRDAKPKAIGPEDLLVRFSGEIYQWILELKDLLRDADAEEDVPTIAVELLNLARGKEIRIGTGSDTQIFNLWR
jgi:hypothetical protein